MKKIISLVFLLILCGCDFKDVSDSIYIASVAVEKNGDEYKGYFYLPSSIEVGNSNPNEESKQGEIGISTGKNITDIFYNIDFSTSLSINYAHIATMIFHESILNNEDIDMLLNFFKDSYDFDFNFYIFATKESIEDIYTFTNPNKESIINTLLVAPHNHSEQFLGADALHFLNFCNYFYTKRCIHIPLIELDYSWKIDDKDTDAYNARGVCFYHDGRYKLINYDEYNLEYLKSNDVIFYSDDNVSVTLRNYKVKYQYKDKIKIKIRGDIDRLVTKDEINIEAYIYDSIKKYVNDTINNLDVDYLNRDYYSKILKKDYSLDDVVLDIRVRTVK